jgi:tetratricopeptide (TPR) repeat protein
MVLLLVAGFALAQEKNVKEAKNLIKGSKPDFKKAEQLMSAALTDASTKDDPETWNVAGLVQKQWYDEEYKKSFLRQPYDTASYYNSLLKMCEYFMKCDDLAQVPDAKGKVKNKYRKANAATIKTERTTLINGGVDAYNKNQSQEALDFFGMYVDIPNHPMFAEDIEMKTDSMIPEIAYYAELAAGRLDNNDAVLKYAPFAMKSKENGHFATELLANAYKAKGDTDKWIETLKLGIQQYPDYAFFFGHLIDYYTNNNKNEEAMKFADDMLAKDPNNPFYVYVKGYLYHNMYDPLKKEGKDAEATAALENALKFYEKTVQVDPNYAEAYSNMGLIYCLLAQDFSMTTTSDVNDAKYASEQAKLKAYYEKALPNYEKARALKPDQKPLWLQGLHRVYYNLGMGPQYEEMDQMISAGGN